jgi:hypothetical protein
MVTFAFAPLRMPGSRSGQVVLATRAGLRLLAFAQRNPRPCPILDVLDPGDPHPGRVARRRRAHRFARLADIPPRRAGARGAGHPRAVARRCSGLPAWLLVHPRSGADRGGRPLAPPGARLRRPLYDTLLNLRPSGPIHGHMVVSMRQLPRDWSAARSRSLPLPRHTRRAHPHRRARGHRHR